MLWIGSAQVDENTAIVDARDTSPSRGYVGFEARRNEPTRMVI